MNTAFRDRSLALAVVGGLEVLAGLALAALGLLAAVVVAATPEAHAAMGGQSMLQVACSLVVYVVAGVALAAAGSGLLACRRWARALSLVFSWAAVAMGDLLALSYAALGPAIFRNLPEAQGQSVPAGLLVSVLVAASLGVLVLPGALGAWILGSEDARLTCEWRDRHVRWTDGIPTGVLALSVAFAFSAISILPAAFAYPAFVAGRVLTGAAALAFYLAFAVVMAVLAVGVKRRRPWAWFASLAVLAAGLLNGMTLFRSGALASFYERMRVPPEQLAMITSLVRSPALLAITSVTGLAALAWLLAIRKHFVAARVA